MLAFELPDGVDRSTAKQALISHLAEDSAASELREVTDPIIQAIDVHRRRVGQESATS